jgi:hypothetical protein
MLWSMKVTSLLTLPPHPSSDLTVPGRPYGINSSVMIWNASRPSDGSSTNALSLISSQLLSSYADITHEMYKFDHYLEYFLSGALRRDTPHTDSVPSAPSPVLFLQDIFPDLFVDYHEAIAMRAEEGTDSFPQSVSVICFPLSPKPHEVCETVPWVRKFWSGPWRS